MRDYDPDIDDILEIPRTANARLTFRRRKLTFTQSVVSDSIGLSDPSTADISLYGTGALRVVNYNDALYTSYIDNLDDTLYPAWSDRSIALKAGSRPGVEGSYVWYQKANGDICYRDYASWSTEYVVISSYASAVTCAPVSGGCYIQTIMGVWLGIFHTTTAGVTSAWAGMIYGDITTARYLDAVTLDGCDYIYTMDRNAGRIVEIRRRGTWWSESKFVIKLDVIDNVTGVTLAYASVINGKIFITARDVISSDAGSIAMDVIIFGPQYSISRWSYLSETNISGKLMLLGNFVYYIGVNAKCIAQATILVGLDNENTKFETQDISAVQIQHSEGNQSSFSAMLASDIEPTDIGDEVEVEFAYNEIYTTMGKFTVEANSLNTAFGVYDQQMSGSGLAFNAASLYVPRQSYFTSSQAQVHGKASDLSHLIRVRGTFSGEGGVAPLTLNEQNEVGILYSTGMASKSGVMRAKFLHHLFDQYTYPRYGVGINYYVDSSYDVAIRESIPQDTVTSEMCGSNGIFAVWGRYEHEGGDGIGLYVMTANTLELLTSESHTMREEEWAWMQIQFVDGVITVSVREEDEVEWTIVITHTYTFEDRAPWPRDVFGRGALYVENGTPFDTTPGLFSDDTVVPMVDISGTFLSADEVIVDSEIISYASIVEATTGDMNVVETPAWGPENFGSVSEHYICVPAIGGAVDGNYVGAALFVKDGTGKGKAFEIIAFDAVAPTKWAPTGVYTYPDAWQDHIGKVGKGSWVASNISRFFVKSNPSGIVNGMATNANPDSVVKVYPALGTLTRGVATTHGNTRVSVNKDPSVEVDFVSSLSGDPDQCIEDVITTILMDAGAPAPTFNRLMPETQVFTGTWSMSPWFRSLNPNVKFVIPSMSSGDEFGIVFRATEEATGSDVDGPDVVEAYMLTLERISASYFLTLQMHNFGGGGWTDVESFPMSEIPPAGCIMRISIHDNTFSVWIDDKLVHSFYDATYDVSDYNCIVSKTAKTILVTVPELMDYIDIFAMDARSNAISVFQGLIGDRRIYWCDSHDGSMRFYRERTSVGNMPDMVYAINHNTTDQKASWTRTESIKFVEEIDHTLARQIGLIYQVLNAQYATSPNDVKEYGSYIRRQLVSNSHSVGVEMAPHPGYEPGDSVILPDSTTIDIIDANISINLNGSSFSCIEQIGGILHA